MSPENLDGGGGGCLIKVSKAKVTFGRPALFNTATNQELYGGRRLEGRGAGGSFV